MILAVVMLSITAAHAQGVYFPSEEGLTVEYANKNAKDKVTGYIAYKFQKIERQDDLNYTVKYQMLMMDGNRKEKGEPINAAVKVMNGTVYLDVTSAFNDAASALGQMSESLVVEGSGLIIPSNAKAGQKLNDASAKIGNIATSLCTNITVTAEEELTTEAGTFQTIRLDMDVAGKVLIIKTEGTSTQWCAKGIGLVRTISYNKKGNVTASMELAKVTR